MLKTSFVSCLILSLFLRAAPAVAQPFGLTQRVPVSGLTFPLDDPGGPGTVRAARAFSGVTFTQPLFVTYPPDGTDRLFIVEKGGLIKVIANSDTATSASIFLDISSKVLTASEQGLLGLAFDPDYAQNGYFYIYYSPVTGAMRSVVARYKVSVNPNVADSASEAVVIEVPQTSFGNHKAGMIAFGPDKMLYIALGDGGSAGDPLGLGQSCADMLGNILRIDPRSASPYQIPSDNPYAGTGSFNCGTLTSAPSRVCGLNGYASGQICKEIYAMGLRNPWRFSFDRLTGALWAGDVGQDAWEEIDLIKPGANYGWPIFEGVANYKNPSNLPLSSRTSPITVYGRGTSGGSSVTGGYVYRGKKLPALYGKYIYGDYGSGNVWALDYDGTQIVSNVRFAGVGGVASFGEDRDGELLAVALGQGSVYRFLPPVSGGATIPQRLSQTGLFSNVSTLAINPGAVEYEVQAALWSDNAVKRRWVLLPGSSQIGFNSTEAYTFPVGTAIVKHFELPISSGFNRRLETRVLFLHNQGWAGYTYKWRTDGSDADLLVDGLKESYQVQDSSAQGGVRTQEWYYPSRTDCMNCHTTSSGRILGVRTRQLNGDFNYPAATDNQLRAWNHIGLFSTDIGLANSYQAYPRYSDTTKTVESRARAYLAANCAHCHQPAEARTGVIDLRYETLLAQTHLVNERPLYDTLGLPDAYRIKPGVPSSSVLYERMRHLDALRMPPIASSLVDTNGVALIGSWITALGSNQVVRPEAPKRLRVGP